MSTDRLTEEQLAITAEHDGIKVDPAAVTVLVDEVRRLQFQCRFLLKQLARKDAASGRGDKALEAFLAGEPTSSLPEAGNAGTEDRP